jgi:hypothetical protein
MKTVTIVSKRHCPKKPRGLHIPFYGRRRTRAKKIALDRLWDIHFRLERRPGEAPLKISTSPAFTEESKVFETKMEVDDIVPNAPGPMKGVVEVNGGGFVMKKVDAVHSGKRDGARPRTRREKPRPRRGTDLIEPKDQRSPEF